MALPGDAHVWATHTALPGGLTWHFVLSLVEAGPLTPVVLTRTDLWPPMGGGDVVVWDYSDLQGSAHLVDGGSQELAVLEARKAAHKESQRVWHRVNASE